MTVPDQRSAPAARVVVVAATLARAEQVRAALQTTVVVVAALRGADQAAAEVDRLRPDVLVVDLSADRGGLALVETVMAATPTPIVCAGSAGTAAAVAAGAVSIVASDGDWAAALRTAVTQAVGVRVIRHPRAHLARRRCDEATEASTMSQIRLVAIGASTGGPPALAALLRALPDDLPVPVLVVQHMAEGFVEGLAQWLDALVALEVRVAEDGDRLRAGVVLLAPAGRNLRVLPGLAVALTEIEGPQFHVPSIDVALGSVAVVCRSRAVGVLLTGMGRDGAHGLLAMRQAGARTLAQDEASSAVYGMPGAACAEGAVETVLALPALAGAIAAACGVTGALR